MDIKRFAVAGVFYAFASASAAETGVNSCFIFGELSPHGFREAGERIFTLENEMQSGSVPSCIAQDWVDAMIEHRGKMPPAQEFCKIPEGGAYIVPEDMQPVVGDPYLCRDEDGFCASCPDYLS